MVMATEPTPEVSPKHDSESNEEMQDIAFEKRGCCFWMPCFESERSSAVRSSWWERIAAAEKEEGGGGGCWWGRGLKALKKVREWSELVAGPKWKTFIRRFNKNRVRQGKFQYDPLSYSLNFDEGQNDHVEDERAFRDFSSRYASVPISAKSSMDLGKDAPSFL
ncbi:hypothetical protein RJ640_024355 [Escallonia rubra]|uniref:Uncharacterized protein n=1 Tax=Escallonia rubra TaxID=112253 RepID=A0AA88S8J9_9ASTE|nr:hypothetical protein RJ640_024355 [Escallonia rubra]